MAVMIPSTPSPDATAGEKKVFRLLERMPSAFTVWMNPSLDGVIADVVVYAPKNGLIVLEVKDWTLDQVLSADRQTVIFRSGWNIERRTCPLGQSHLYLNRLKSMFQRSGDRLFLLPLHCGTVFPCISRADYLHRLKTDASIRDLTSPETTFFQDDLESLERSMNRAEAFQFFLNSHFPALFPWEHSTALLGVIRKKLGVSAIVELPGTDWKSGEKKLVTLDEEQEMEALCLSGGRRLLRGPAGSGKTLVLVRRAVELIRRGQCRRVLFLCFNLCLAGYIKRLFSARAVPLGPHGVDVMPVYDLASLILGDGVEEQQDGDYYETVQTMALEELNRKDHPVIGLWDAVFVDEAQDFSPMMVDMISRILKPGAPLLAAMDSDQHIYAASCPEAWLDMPGIKTSALKKRYRCTREIMAFAEDWLGGRDYLPDDALGINEGVMPKVLAASTMREAALMAAEETAGMRLQGMNQRDLAVLWSRDRAAGASTRLSALLADALADRGCLSQWPVKDDRAKKNYDITTDSVVISTIHSMKGMDFAHVTLVLPLSQSEGRAASLLKDMKDRRDSWEKHHAHPVTSPSLHALLYVGMTRARQSLTVIWYDDGSEKT